MMFMMLPLWIAGAIALLVLLSFSRRLLGAKFRQNVVMALRNLLLHKLRAFLSVLGIIIGTASEIVLMAFGEGSMRDALEDIKRQGATNLIVVSVKPSEDAAGSQRQSAITRYGLTPEDHE